MSRTIFDRQGVQLSTVARPGGPLIQVTIVGAARDHAQLSHEAVREMTRALREWLREERTLEDPPRRVR